MSALLYMHVCVYTHKHKCAYVSVYLIQGRVKKELTFPPWEMTSYGLAFLELFLLLNYLYQGH